MFRLSRAPCRGGPRPGRDRGGAGGGHGRGVADGRDARGQGRAPRLRGPGRVARERRTRRGQSVIGRGRGAGPGRAERRGNTPLRSVAASAPGPVPGRRLSTHTISAPARSGGGPLSWMRAKAAPATAGRAWRLAARCTFPCRRRRYAWNCPPSLPDPGRMPGSSARSGPLLLIRSLSPPRPPRRSDIRHMRISRGQHEQAAHGMDGCQRRPRQ
jgi:hypothetical protein